ncbi:MAG: hypothetical protein IPJ65_14485 [Archangiaceae bacterium]|nr:hypothetical protein [Archangiaceae bacterium]
MNARLALAAFSAALLSCGGGSSTARLSSPAQAGAGGASGTFSTDPRDKAAPVDRTLSFYYGPMKLMTAEAILYSVASFTGHSFGTFDFTAPDPAARAFADAGNTAGTMYRHCPFFGGCMEHRIPLGRTSFMGTGWVLELERAVVEACNDRAAFQMLPGNRAPDATTLAVDVVRHQFMRAFGAQPTDADLQVAMAYMQSHLAAPELTGVTPLESAGRGLCRALLTTNRFLLY